MDKEETGLTLPGRNWVSPVLEVGEIWLHPHRDREGN